MGATLWRPKPHRRVQEPWTQREPGDPRLSFREELTKTRNWFDLLRGAAGSLALFGGHGIQRSIGAESDGATSGLSVLAVQVAVLSIGLAIQVARRERGRGSLFAPVFYLAGIGVGLCGGWAALFGFVLVWAVNPMLANAVGFLMVQGLAIGGFGLLLRGLDDGRAVLACMFCLMPALASMLLRRPLIVFSRKTSTEGPR